MGGFVTQDILSDSAQFHLEKADLLLESIDDAHAAVDWVTDARVGFVHQAAHGIRALILGDVYEHLGHVAGAEDFVHGCEFLWLVRREVGREWTFLCTSPAQ